MAARMIPGQTAEIAGPKKAFVFPKPEVAASMIKRAKRPLFVIGSDGVRIETKDGNLVDTAMRLLKKSLTVVATGHLVGEFRKKGADDAHGMPLMNLGDRLRDPNWEGFDGDGSYDLVVFVGIQYYMEWLVLSGLKNFAQDLRTVSLDRSYQPNASWSLGTMPEEDWKEVLDVIISNIEEGA